MSMVGIWRRDGWWAVPRLCSVTVMEWTLSLPGCVHFLGVAESHLADVGGGLAEVAVGAWLRAMVPFTASELDQHRWPGPDPANDPTTHHADYSGFNEPCRRVPHRLL